MSVVMRLIMSSDEKGNLKGRRTFLHLSIITVTLIRELHTFSNLANSLLPVITYGVFAHLRICRLNYLLFLISIYCLLSASLAKETCFAFESVLTGELFSLALQRCPFLLFFSSFDFSFGVAVKFSCENRASIFSFLLLTLATTSDRDFSDVDSSASFP
jgi:hypothetical protein